MDNKLGITITAFILLIIGVVLLTEVGDQVAITTDSDHSTTYVFDEQITAENDTITYLANDDLRNLYNITNSTDVVMVAYRDYTFDLSSGWVLVYANASDPDSHTGYNVTYDYIPSTYVQNGTARNLLDLIVLFFAVGLVFGVGGWIVMRSGMLDGLVK